MPDDAGIRSIYQKENCVNEDDQSITGGHTKIIVLQIGKAVNGEVSNNTC